MKDQTVWLFQPHRNVEFGKTRAYSRFANFVATNIACGIIRLPVDLSIWLAVFYLGHRFGGLIFG
jgi:hypothetical protein